MGKKGISRRDALKSLGVIGAGSMVGGLSGSLRGKESSAPKERVEGKQPNILFIMTDDHAVSALSCYGSRINETPNLDRIASEGVKFNNCFVTNSLCAPSRATILTGKYSHLHGVTENIFGEKKPFDNTQQTFPKLLQEHGYQTALIGKWHLKSDPTGFDYWNRLPGQGRYNNPAFIEMGERKRHEGYATDLITDFTINAIQNKLSSDKPWCLFSWHKAPHRGWIPDEEHEDMYTDQDLPVPPTFNDDYYTRSSAATHAYMDIADMPDWRKLQPEGMTDTEKAHWNYQQYIKRYLRTVASLDDNIGRLLDFLEESGLAENTIVVYTTDNGMFIGEHGYFDKRFMYEESIRIPLMVRYPAEIPAGLENDNVVLNLDFGETFLDYAGVEIPGDMQGESMRDLMRGVKNPEWRDSIYYHYYEYPGPHKVRPHYGVRTDRYKLIYFYTIDEWELFDLEQDPYELNNVYDAPAYADIVSELKKDIKAKRKQYKDDTGKEF